MTSTFCGQFAHLGVHLADKYTFVDRALVFILPCSHIGIVAATTGKDLLAG